jgi:hypothetical protein
VAGRRPEHPATPSNNMGNKTMGNTAMRNAAMVSQRNRGNILVESVVEIKTIVASFVRSKGKSLNRASVSSFASAVISGYYRRSNILQQATRAQEIRRRCAASRSMALQT